MGLDPGDVVGDDVVADLAAGLDMQPEPGQPRDHLVHRSTDVLVGVKDDAAAVDLIGRLGGEASRSVGQGLQEGDRDARAGQEPEQREQHHGDPAPSAGGRWAGDGPRRQGLRAGGPGRGDDAARGGRPRHGRVGHRAAGLDVVDGGDEGRSVG